MPFTSGSLTWTPSFTGGPIPPTPMVAIGEVDAWDGTNYEADVTLAGSPEVGLVNMPTDRGIDSGEMVVGRFIRMESFNSVPSIMRHSDDGVISHVDPITVLRKPLVTDVFTD